LQRELSIIIINWNSVDYLRKCLKSIFLNTHDIEFEIIVLDNASYDGCGEVITSEFPDVHFVQSMQNLGFARGNNFAASFARSNVLLFLNPDTEINGPAIKSLYHSYISISDAGAMGARLLNSDGSLQTSCVQAFPSISNQFFDADLVRKLFPKARLWGMAPLFCEVCTPVEVEAISGACLMTGREVFQKVGGFSEEYFMYYEDIDYCLKVGRAGWKNYFVPTAAVTHHGGKSSGGDYSRFSTVMMAESGWRFLRKQRGLAYANMFRACLAISAASRFLLLALACAFTSSGPLNLQARAALRKWTYILSWCLRLGGSANVDTRE